MDNVLIKLIIGILLACLVFFFAVGGFITMFFGARKVSSAKRIEPKIELIINNNQVDTLFVYELK